MLPIKDDIPTRRFPVLTVAIIVACCVVYFGFEQGLWGLGETKEELLETFGVLREHGVQILTVGQYLRPTRDHLPVVRYWHPDEFAELEREAYAIGFESVAAGPLVRSSYHAEQTLAQASAQA